MVKVPTEVVQVPNTSHNGGNWAPKVTARMSQTYHLTLDTFLLVGELEVKEGGILTQA